MEDVKIIPCKFPKDEAKRLRVVAALQGITVSELIRRAIKSYLEHNSLDLPMDKIEEILANKKG